MPDQKHANSEQTRRDPAKRQRQALERRVQNAMTTIYDPATPNIDLYNMGMIYAVRVEMPGGAGADARVVLDLAYSSPGHPGNIGLVQRVESTVHELEGVEDCKVNVVSDPPWSLDRVSDHARINMSVVD